MDDLRQTIPAFCRQHGLRLNTDLGQHFLVDQDILHQIVAAGEIGDGECIVEIGPGIGVLTKELVTRAGHVTAIEVDERFPPLVHAYCSNPNNLEIVLGNALHVRLPEEPYKIIANIPYHITSPLLRHAFLESETTPISLTLLIQKEVAENICDTKNAGILTILVGLFGASQIVCAVPPSSFLPPPKVDSAVLHVECFHEPKASKDIVEEVFRLTKIGFSQKRKMLRNTFGTIDNGLELLEEAGIDLTRRPQTLSVDEWIALAEIRLSQRK